MKRLALIALMSILPGCQTVIDRSIRAVDAADLTLVGGCSAMPGRGADICRFKEGQSISSSWNLVVPAGERELLGGEVVIYGLDQPKTFPVKDKVVVIPWRDIFGDESWKTSHAGVLTALAQIRWKTPEGIEEIWNAKGVAIVLVLKQGYDEIPIDSGFSAWGTKCKVQYSTAGRSALECH